MNATFEYVDYKLFDGQPLTCQFEVDGGSKETKFSPERDSGLFLMSAKLNDSDITELLKDKAIELLTQDASEEWATECAEREVERREYMSDLLENK